jgi:glucose-6-phosphate 1-dehydrogenase
VIERLVLFGATGDLAGRFLFPAIAALLAGGHLPDDFAVTAAARQDLDEDAFRRHVDERLVEHAVDVPKAACRALLRSLRYRAVEVTDRGSVASVLAGPASPVAVYLALPPNLFPAAVDGVGQAGLPGGGRIVLEKPFGEDLDSAVELNRLLTEVVGDAGEQAVFRVDHVLGMATAQNLVALRHNRVLGPVWNGTHVERVEILWEETLALEGRAGYYDTAGALKDVLQNHMLQLLCLVAMELPGNASERELRDRKAEALGSVRPLKSRRARYCAGQLAEGSGASGESVPAYADEEGVDPTRGTETFVELTLGVESERWRGTQFVLRAGKALARRRKGVVIRFRPGDDNAANELWIGIDGPNNIVMRLSGEGAERPLPLLLRGEPPAPQLPAYARVLLDVLSGGSTLSVRGDEAEESWRVVMPVIEGWREDRVPLEEYPAGSKGPP